MVTARKIPATYDYYIALGDSMSIDCYPATDARESGITPENKIGAAALFYQNEPELFAEFAGQDLKTFFPGINYNNMVLDGATTDKFIAPDRIAELDKVSDRQVLITLTVGGNDLLESFSTIDNGTARSPKRSFDDICQSYVRGLKLLNSKLPQSTLIVTTLFDPSDGSGHLPSDGEHKFPTKVLLEFNQWIKDCASSQTALLADVYQHFRGHGAGCDSPDSFWYWKKDPIEPSYVGASEIRRVWLQVLSQVHYK